MRLHTAELMKFIGRHDTIILTTHDPADADGLGAEMVFACILRKQGKKFRIINASATPRHFQVIDAQNIIEQWDDAQHAGLLEQAGLILLDTGDADNTGVMRDAVCRAKDIWVVDHHEPKPNAVVYAGISDPSSASASELAVALAESMGTPIDPQTAFAAYIGIAYDTGFFAYPKTGPRTLRAALLLLEKGVETNEVYRLLHENASTGKLLLQQQAIASMTLHCQNRVAVQILRFGDFTAAGALPEETDGLVNFPLKSRDIVVSLMIKEPQEGKIRCSLRSKGAVNVAKIAQEFHGGGHVNASGFKSKLTVNETLEAALAKIAEHLDKP
ncbi:MAG: DHHA1 domain-containing protein [Treponema sp.]|nr:DHHA1 domain-containing protein [Treponema sp.]